MEYQELNLLFLNHNFSILPDTRIGPYRGVSGRIGYGYGTHFEVSVIHRVPELELRLEQLLALLGDGHFPLLFRCRPR